MTDRQPATTPETPDTAHPGTALGKRHVTTISLCGIIGAGLFAGGTSPRRNAARRAFPAPAADWKK